MAWTKIIDGDSDLGDIGDVTLTSITSGEVIMWNGSGWINATLAELGAVSTTDSRLVVAEEHSGDMDGLIPFRDTGGSGSSYNRFAAWGKNTYHWEEHFSFDVASGLNARGMFDASVNSTIQNPGTVEKQGAIELVTGTTLNDRAVLIMAAQAATDTPHDPSEDFIIEFWAKFPSLPTTYHIYFGLLATDIIGTNGIYFQAIDTNNSGFWEGKTTSGGSTSTVSHGSQAPDNTYRRFKIVRTSSGVGFFLNGTQIGSTITTNIPTANLKFAIGTRCRSGGDGPQAIVDFSGLHSESPNI